MLLLLEASLPHAGLLGHFGGERNIQFIERVLWFALAGRFPEPEAKSKKVLKPPHEDQGGTGIR